MTDQPDERFGLLPDLPRAILLMFLACISGLIVWSLHATDWAVFISSIAIGGFIGLMAGGLFGVPLLPTLMMMLIFGGMFEGIHQGFSYFGLVGAIVGGLIADFRGPRIDDTF